MLKAVADRDMHRFLRYFEFVYDKPSSDVFSYTVCSIRSHVEKFQESKDQIINQTANNLLKALPIMEQPVFSELPNQETVQYAHTQTIKELGDLINIPFEDSKINAIQIQEAFKSALTYIDANEWKTLIDEESSQSSISTNQELQTIKIPESRSVTKNKLANLIVHEIGTHVARRINGERSSLKLLGLGLDRYEVGEEGIATMREQALNNKVDDFRGIEGQLAVGLGLGVDGQPRDFREVYEIMEKYYLFKNLVAKKEFSDAQTKAQNSAWNRTVRTFRGTDCNTPGVCLTKDIIYSDGNIGIWNVIKKIQMRCSVLT